MRDAELYLALDAREDRRAGLLEVSGEAGEHDRARVARGALSRRDPPRATDAITMNHGGGSSARISSGTTTCCSARTCRRPSTPPKPGLVLAEALRPAGGRLDSRAARRRLSGSRRLDFVRQARARIELARVQRRHARRRASRWPVREKPASTRSSKADFVPFLQSRLAPIADPRAPGKRALATHRPQRTASSLTYESGRPPILAVRLQELFGWTETPRVARGRVAVLLHLLGPNNRPVQITNDLRSFWTTTYHQVRKDLRGRYPKHAWPEDPFTAQPSIKGKPK